MRRAVSLLAVLALLVIVPAMQAGIVSVTITFGTSGGTAGFTGGGSTVGPVDLSFLGATGLNLTVSPYSTGNSAPSWAITSSGSGYGVDNSAAVGDGSDDSDTIDNSGFTDSLQFTFSNSILLTNVLFGSWDDNDEADFHTGSIFGSNTHITVYSSNGSNWNLPDITTDAFFFRAGDGSGSANDDFRIRALSFDYNVPETIPEPATYGLMGLGLLGLGLLRRRMSRVR